MKPLQQFNSMIQFYCTAHSGDAKVSVFENNGRVITHVRHEDWKFTIKVDQDNPCVEMSFINDKDDEVHKTQNSAPSYSHLLPTILAFHFARMSEVAN